jgi:hypothetical protein
MSHRLHPDARRIAQRLSRERITALYHFTSIENLDLIRQMGGLCSKQVLEDAGQWPPPEPGGNELSHNLDRYNNNWDKVSLNFTPHTPMAYRKKPGSHLCFFIVNTDVACRSGVVFTDSNAASTGNQQRDEGLSGLNLVNFGAIRSRPQPWDRDGWVRPVQAEVLVPDRINLSDVLKVCFVSQASLEEGQRMWGNHQSPAFSVEPRCFSDTPPSIGLNFSHLKSILMTDAKVDKDNVDDIPSGKNRFSRATCQRITVLASVHAIAGTQAQITWQPAGVVEQEEFEKSSEYWHWPSLPIRQLPDGKCSVEYRLGGIRWATLEFNVRP